MIRNKFSIVFILIILLATFLRFFKLGDVPISPDWDEAALGYNAYSIFHTGRDEYGKFFPIILRSFDDYKPAMYTYFIVPFLLFFDLSVVAVRLPSAIFGILSVVALYFIVRLLFPDFKIGKIGSTELALLSSFLLAISPWHVHFSRIAFESQVGTAFNIFAVLFFLIGLRKHKLLLLSAIIMGVNVYIYQSEKVFTPLLLLALIIIYRKKILEIPRRYLVGSIAVGLIVVLPMFFSLILNSESLKRAQGVSVFSDQTSFLKEAAQRLLIDKEKGDIVGQVFDNRRLLFVKAVIAGYLSHFNLNWLFLEGDIARHHAPGMGLMYLVELPFLLIGIYALFFGKEEEGISKSTKLFIFLWLLLAPLPASITSGVPHAVRTMNFLPSLQILTALGIITFTKEVLSIEYKVFSIKIKYATFSLLCIVGMLNFIYYLNQYFVQLNFYYAKEWQYGYSDAVSYVRNVEDKYKKIIVTNKPYLDQSYIFFLFYLKYPPNLYQKEGGSLSGGFKENHTFGKYEFRDFKYENEVDKNGTLFVGRMEDFSSSVNASKTIYFPNGKEAIKIVGGI